MLNQSVQSVYYQGVNGFGSKMSSNVGFAQGSSAALKSIWGRVQNQVFMMSFLQMVYVLMGIVAISFIPLYRIKLKLGATKIVDAH